VYELPFCLWLLTPHSTVCLVFLCVVRGTPLRVYTNEPSSMGRAPQRSPVALGAASGSSAQPMAVAPAMHGTGPVITYGGAWAQPSAAAASLVANMRPLRPVGLPSDYNNSFKSRTKAKVNSSAEVPTMVSLDASVDSPAPAPAPAPSAGAGAGAPANPNVDLQTL
jgi:hypothetical protein